MVTPKNKKVVREFENVIDNAKLRALQKISLTRQLSPQEVADFTRLGKLKLQGKL